VRSRKIPQSGRVWIGRSDFGFALFSLLLHLATIPLGVFLPPTPPPPRRELLPFFSPVDVRIKFHDPRSRRPKVFFFLPHLDQLSIIIINMLFQRPANTILSLSRNVVRRAKSSSSGAAAEESFSGGLAAAVGVTFGTYMIADFLSNFIQHPTQKVRDSLYLMYSKTNRKSSSIFLDENFVVVVY